MCIRDRCGCGGGGARACAPGFLLNGSAAASAEAERLSALARASQVVTAGLEARLREWCGAFAPDERDGGDLSAFVHAIGASRRTTRGLLGARDEALRPAPRSVASDASD